jgi:hypothetical protein
LSPPTPGSGRGMSRQQVELFLRWIRDDHAFAAQAATDASSMNGYDMTREEREALLRGDLDALRRLGVDERLLPAVNQVAGPAGPGTSVLT